MPNLVADFFLLFSHFEMLVPILLIGFLWVNRALFFQTTCIAVFDLMVNVALKGTFKVPLSPLLHKIGYAFPSGHMQLVTVFYGWLALHIPYTLFRVAMLLIVFGVGAGLIHYDYHNVLDVSAGLLFGLLLIVCFQLLLSYFKQKASWILLMIATLCMGYNAWVYTGIPRHAIIAYAVLMVLLTIERIVSKNGSKFNSWVTRVTGYDVMP